MSILRLWVNAYEKRGDEHDIWFEEFEDSDRLTLAGDSMFQGKVLLLSSTLHCEWIVSLDVRHSPRTGWGLTLRNLNDKQLPEAPFLITSDLRTVVIWNGKVVWNPVEPGRAPEQCNDLTESIPVGTNRWFGILRVLAAQAKPDCHLLAFSEDSNSRIIANEIVMQMDVALPIGHLSPE